MSTDTTVVLSSKRRPPKLIPLILQSLLKMCLTLALASALFVSLTPGEARAQDYGVPINGYPMWQERVMLTAINACRMSPTDFRDFYLQYPYILDPAFYPPVPPLLWCEGLNHAARFHSEDMASCNTLQHISCDGTGPWDRLATFYPYPPYGENVAKSTDHTSLGAVVLWLEDGGAPDGSAGDGHRRLIMDSSYTEAGAGYCYAPHLTYQHWYTVDFAGGVQVNVPLLVDGTHLFIDGGVTSFWANYYDPSITAPQVARIYVDGQPHDLTLTLGSFFSGTWMLDLPTASDCRSYSFFFIDGYGQEHWYPESGLLRTYGEGACTEDYDPGSSEAPSLPAHQIVLEPASPNPFNPSTLIRFQLDRAADVRLTIVDLRGRHVRTLLVDRLDAGPHEMSWRGRDDAGRSVASGVYQCRLQADGVQRVQPLTLVR